MSAIFHLDESIRQEFTVETDGKAFITRRGIGRLCGVEHTSIMRLLDKIKGGALADTKTLEKLSGQDFEGGALIPDTVATCIIEYYAFDAGRYCTEQAWLVYRTFAAIGFRTWVQSELGWRAEPTVNASTTPLGLMAALAQEMVKIESRVNQHDEAIAQLTTQVNQFTRQPDPQSGLTAELVEKILEFVQRKGGTASVRNVQRCFGKPLPSAQQIKRWFRELENLGHGKTASTGRSLIFTIRPQLTVLS